MHRRQLLVKLHQDSSDALKASPNGRKLAVARCGERGCGMKLATVTATRMGPVFLAWPAWSASSLPLVSDEDPMIVALAAETDPDVFGASLLAIQQTQEERYRKERKPSLVLELLNHPVPVAGAVPSPV